MLQGMSKYRSQFLLLRLYKEKQNYETVYAKYEVTFGLSN